MPNKHLKISLLLIVLAAVLTLTQTEPNKLAAQSSGSDVILYEDFSNGFIPPRFNNAFNHSFTLATAWDLTGVGVGDPISQTPPFALRLFAGNEDRITFNQAARAYVSEAEIWGYAPSDENGQNIGRGRIIFEGPSDSKTFDFSGRVRRWQQFQVDETTVGDSGRALGGIVAIRLIDAGSSGYAPMFDDLRVISTTPPYRTDLTLTMSGPASPVRPGDQLVYNLTVTNNGPEMAPDVLVENVVPFGGIYIDATSDVACNEEVGGVAFCRLGTIPVNGSRTFAVGIEVSSEACNTFSNRATVTFDGLDIAPLNNVAAVTNTTPNPICADMTVTHTATPQPPFTNENFSYLITAVNRGTDPAGGTLTHTLPPEVNLREILPGAGVNGCTSSGQTITCDLGTMVPHRPKKVEIVVRPQRTFAGVLRSETAVSGTLFDPVPANNTHVHRFGIGPRYDYTVIAALGEAELAGYERLLSLDLNSEGQVAFLVDGPRIVRDFGIFRGDGETLTTIVTNHALPPLPDGEEYLVRGGEEISQNDLGEVAFVINTSRIEGPSTLSSAIYVGSGEAPQQIVYRWVGEGSNTRRIFDHRVYINNRGELTTAFDVNVVNEPSALVRYDANGERIFFYELSSTNDNIISLGSSRQGIMYVRRIGRYGLQTDLNVFYRNATRPLFQQTFNINYQANLNRIKLAYSDRGYHVHRALIPDRTSNTARMGIYGGFLPPYAPQVEVLVPLGTREDYIGHPALNNEHEFAFYCQGAVCRAGIYTGQPGVETNVASLLYTIIDGTHIYRFLRPAYDIDINDRGQIAFFAELEDGRQVVVRADPTRDNDGDGRSDVEESNGPRSGDGNFDGINDGSQLHVATFRNGENRQYVTFEADEQARITDVRSIDNPDRDTAPPDVTFPVGHFEFEVADIVPGSATTVTFYSHGSSVASWWKYGPTPDNPTPHWYEFTYDGRTGAEVLGSRVILHFVDGERGDSDLTANGIILDPGGPAAFPYAIFLPFVDR